MTTTTLLRRKPSEPRLFRPASRWSEQSFLFLMRTEYFFPTDTTFPCPKPIHHPPAKQGTSAIKKPLYTGEKKPYSVNIAQLRYFDSDRFSQNGRTCHETAPLKVVSRCIARFLLVWPKARRLFLTGDLITPPDFLSLTQPEDR